MFFSRIKKIFGNIKKVSILLNRYLLAIFYLILFFDIFLYPRISNLLSIFLIIIWIFFIYTLRLKVNQTFILGLIAYASTFTFQFFGRMMTVEKGVTWFAIFLTISFVQMLFKKQPRDEK